MVIGWLKYGNVVETRIKIVIMGILITRLQLNEHRDRLAET